MAKFYDNASRLEHLRAMVASGDEHQATRLCWEWFKQETFGLNEFRDFCHIVARYSEKFVGK